MKTKPNKVSISDNKELELHANWSENAILQMFNLEEHPKIKLCNEYLKSMNFLPSKIRKR